MGRKSSDGSGVGADLLHALGFNKFSNSTDDSEIGDNKNKNHPKLGKLKFPKNKKKSSKKSNNVDSGKISMEIDLKPSKDNVETGQGSEKTSTSSLVDVQISFETILNDLQKTILNIKKNVDLAESYLENVYVSVDKLEKFTELCKVENEDVILGLHKLVNVHKGAALLSTFSNDPTFKKNYDYNVNDKDGKSAERRLENQRFVDTNVKESEGESNVANVIETHNSNSSETKPAFVKSKSNILNNSARNANSNVTDTNPVSESLPSSFNTQPPSSESTLKSENQTDKKSNSNISNNNAVSDKANNNEKSPKEGKISKTEKFKEKLNLKMRKKKDNHCDDNNDHESADAENSSGHQTRMEKFKRKFDRKSK